MEEELGLRRTDCSLKEAFVHRCGKTETFHGKIFRNREIFTVYFAKISIETPLFPQKEEIAELLWMDAELILKHLSSQDREFCMDPDVFSKILDHIRKQEQI